MAGHLLEVRNLSVRFHTVRGPVDPQKGWIVDYGDIAAAWRPLHERLDHNYLNEIEGLENPTSEVLAAWIFDRFHVAGARVHAVKVCETCTSSCTVTADDAAS